MYLEKSDIRNCNTVKNPAILDSLLLYPCDSYLTTGVNLRVFFMMSFGSQRNVIYRR